MSKLGVDVEVEAKPKILLPEKRKLEPLIPTHTIKKDSVDDDEDVDILGDEDINTTIAATPLSVPTNKKRPVCDLDDIPVVIEHNVDVSIKLEHNADVVKSASKVQDLLDLETVDTVNTAPTNNFSNFGNSLHTHGSDVDIPTTSTDAQNSLPPTESCDPHDLTDHSDHSCTKCNNNCNNCNNCNNNNNKQDNINNTKPYNNNNNNNLVDLDNVNMENNEDLDECDMDSTSNFEPHLDYPVPTEEKILDPNTASPEELVGNKEFFCGNSAKTPERYLKIRNTIVDQWLKCKPKYLSKTSVRTSLKDCGDVNAIGRVHEFLELIGAINFGADRPPRYRHPKSVTPTQSASPNWYQQGAVQGDAPNTGSGEEVTGPRKRRVRTRTGEWVYEDEQNVTLEHKSTSGTNDEMMEEYEHQRIAALNAKYFAEIEEDDIKKRLPRNKRAKYYSHEFARGESTALDDAPYQKKQGLTQKEMTF